MQHGRGNGCGLSGASRCDDAAEVKVTNTHRNNLGRGGGGGGGGGEGREALIKAITLSMVDRSSDALITGSLDDKVYGKGPMVEVNLGKEGEGGGIKVITLPMVALIRTDALITGSLV